VKELVNPRKARPMKDKKRREMTATGTCIRGRGRFQIRRAPRRKMKRQDGNGTSIVRKWQDDCKHDKIPEEK
jgi:hypothetical protein